jgi:hypothetical protein
VVRISWKFVREECSVWYTFFMLVLEHRFLYSIQFTKRESFWGEGGILSTKEDYNGVGVV